MNDYLSSIDRKKLTPTERDILQFLLQNSSRAAWMTLDDICQEIYVSNASIVRFCNHIGLKGFNELKFILRNDHDEKEKPIYDIVPRQLASFQDSLSSVSSKAIKEICREIQSGKEFYIYGRNLSAVPAGYLYDMMMALDHRCILVDWMDALESLAETAQPDTFLLVMSDNAHTEYYPILQKFSERGTSVVWMCNEQIHESFKHYLKDFILCDDPGSSSKLSVLIYTQLIIDIISSNMALD